MKYKKHVCVCVCVFVVLKQYTTLWVLLSHSVLIGTHLQCILTMLLLRRWCTGHILTFIPIPPPCHLWEIPGRRHPHLSLGAQVLLKALQLGVSWVSSPPSHTQPGCCLHHRAGRRGPHVAGGLKSRGWRKSRPSPH